MYNIIKPNGLNVQETVTIDNEKNAAIINIHAGSCSSTTIFDYKHVSSKEISYSPNWFSEEQGES